MSSSSNNHSFPDQFFDTLPGDFYEIAAQAPRPGFTLFGIRSSVFETPDDPILPNPPPPEDTDSNDSKRNKLTEATVRIMRAFQTKPTWKVEELMAIAQLDNKRVYDVVNGLIWAGVITRNPCDKVYQYQGVVGSRPVELGTLGGTLESLRKERDEKAAKVQELRDMLVSSSEEERNGCNTNKF
jgi:hypothetical protein